LLLEGAAGFMGDFSCMGLFLVFLISPTPHYPFWTAERHNRVRLLRRIGIELVSSGLVKRKRALLGSKPAEE
jgi:hypothetical protein